MTSSQFVGNAVYLSLFLFSYFLWTQIFGYQFPIPWLGYILTSTVALISLSLMWFQFPLEWRGNARFKKRMKLYCWLILFKVVLEQSYQMMIEKIRQIQVDYQPFAALALPATREASIWIGSKLASKCCDGDEKGAKIFFQYTV